VARVAAARASGAPSATLRPMPDFSRVPRVLRVAFPYLIALFLPLAGLVLGIVQFAEGDRDRGLRIIATAVLGGSLLLLFVYN
jgi:hypothetical protein